MEIAPRTWYSGTPEPDRFPRNDPGNVLVVTIDGGGAGVGAAPRVEKGRRRPLSMAPMRDLMLGWRRGRPGVRHRGHDRECRRATGGYPSPPQRLGHHDLAGRRRIEGCLDAWQARLVYLHRDLERLIDEPSPDDLDSIDRSGFVRAAIDVLKAKADDPATRRAKLPGPRSESSMSSTMEAEH